MGGVTGEGFLEVVMERMPVGGVSWVSSFSLASTAPFIFYSRQLFNKYNKAA